ncbi:MAG: vitamin K epoxide reductase family protein [Nanoarchaeota archaeon]
MLKEVLLIILSAIGIWVSGYLVYAHYKKKSLDCPLDHDCSVVTESRWNKIFLVRNDVLGLLFYIAVLIATIVVLINQTFSPVFFMYMTYIGGAVLLFSIFLVYIQFFVIKDYCFYCMISAAVNLLIFLVVVW